MAGSVVTTAGRREFRLLSVNSVSLFVLSWALVGLWPTAVEAAFRQRVVQIHGKTLRLEHHQDNHKGPLKMGMDPGCDDARTNITRDWPNSGSLLCPRPNLVYPLYGKLQNKKECMDLPPDLYDFYTPDHYCMYTELRYDEVIPVIEGHRPVWPVFGEYVHVPRQRYLHSIEHGSIVMLYHPCAAENLVTRLRSLVTRCVRKYIISREPLLDPNYPVALAAWGCRLQMNYINDTEVIQFMKDHARTGYEGVLEKQGSYNFTLLRESFYPPGMLEFPDKPAQGQNMDICPGESLEGHFSVYDEDHEVPVGVDRTPHAAKFSFLNYPLPTSDEDFTW